MGEWYYVSLLMPLYSLMLEEICLLASFTALKKVCLSGHTLWLMKEVAQEIIMAISIFSTLDLVSLEPTTIKFIFDI